MSPSKIGVYPVIVLTRTLFVFKAYAWWDGQNFTGGGMTAQSAKNLRNVKTPAGVIAWFAQEAA